MTAENLADAIRGVRALGFSGLHCGNPHKEAIVALLDRTTETAAMIGAVNLVYRVGGELVGENTEGMGFMASLARLTEPAGRRVVLFGAGRAARAIGVELAKAGAAEITVVDQTEQRGGELAGLLAGKLHVAAASVVWAGDYEPPVETDVLINATSIGQRDPDASIPIRLDGLRPETIVADVNIEQPRTWLLQQAQQRGCPTLDGVGMYIDQVAAAVKIWTGVDPDRQVLREAVEEYLEV